MEYDSIKKIYHAQSNFYDFLFKQFFYPRQKYAINAMDIKPGDRILDVGVGTGLALQCYPKNCEVIGIDLSASMLKEAKKKKDKQGLNHVTLLEMDACDLQFDDNEFDHVVATFVITVVPSPVKALSEMKRVCKDGRPLVIVNHFRSDNKFVAKTEEFVNPLCQRIGWRTNVSLPPLLEEAELKVDSHVRMKKIDLWSIVFASSAE